MIKQVIVMRTDLNMRKGKMIAQGAHAAMLFMLEDTPSPEPETIDDWLYDGMTKICVGVGSETELMEIYEKANSVGITVNMVTDKGLTEFSGVPTKTCLAIGPDDSDEINKITGYLKLL